MGGKNVKEELLKNMDDMFTELMKKEDITYERVKWELDYLVYPGIGSYIACGDISQEEGREVFAFCEKRLSELKGLLENR